MPVHVAIEHPDSNDVRLSPRFIEQGTGAIHVTGTGNVLHIADPFFPSSGIITLTGGARVIIEEQSNLGPVAISALAAGVSIEIGAWASFNGFSHIAAHEPARISVGPNCLIGPECSFAASDVHKILDVQSGARLNPAGDIVIGAHVWIAPRTSVLRNTLVGRDCIVGYGTLLKGEFPDNSLIAGNPARILRRGVTWEF